MTRASIKGKYEAGSHASSAAFTVNVNAGDLKLKATCTDATFRNGPSLDGIGLGVEKPGFFIVDYDIPRKAGRFQFMSSAKVAEKQLKLTYINSTQRENQTLVEGSLLFDPSNKVTGKYNFAAGKGQLKYTYVHGGDTTFEPAYDFATDSWNFAVSQKIYGDDTLKAAYDTSRKQVGLEWTRESKDAGSFKVSFCFSAFGVLLVCSLDLDKWVCFIPLLVVLAFAFSFQMLVRLGM